MKTKGSVTLWMVVFATIGCGDTGYKGRTVEVTSKWSNGNVKVVSRDGSDLKIGCWDTFYPDGMKWSLNCFSNGVTDGIYQTWHPNGAVNILGHYSRGFETGVWQFSDSTGVVVREFDATPG